MRTEIVDRRLDVLSGPEFGQIRYQKIVIESIRRVEVQLFTLLCTQMRLIFVVPILRYVDNVVLAESFRDCFRYGSFAGSRSCGNPDDVHLYRPPP